jgi:hypothetical protein
VDVPELVGIHIAGVALHVAAVRQVNDEKGPTAVFDAGNAMPMNVLVGGTSKISAKIQILEPAEEIRVRRDDVLKQTVLSADLPHDNPASFLKNMGLDKPWVAFQPRNWLVASEDCVSYVSVALRADGISYPWKPKGRT